MKRVRLAQMVLAFVLILACGKKRPPTTTADVSMPPPDPAPKAQTVLPSKSPGHGMTKIIAEKRVPIVGGCSLHCTNPEDSVRNFLLALLRTRKERFSTEHDAQKNPMLFLESRSLTVDQEHIAADWHVLWTEGRFKDRVTGIHQWMYTFRKPIVGMLKSTDGPTLVREGLSANPQKAYGYRFMAPGLDAPWRFVTQQRGVEWLIVSISKAP